MLCVRELITFVEAGIYHFAKEIRHQTSGVGSLSARNNRCALDNTKNVSARHFKDLCFGSLIARGPALEIVSRHELRPEF
jgi:hypothetical protein